MNIVMMGIQGSGKGTQAKMLSAHLGLPHVSVGDLFRDNIAKGTVLGLKAKSYMDKGALVPDTIVINMVRDHLDRPDMRGGFILDGFPRNGVQLAAMELLKPVDHAVLLELDEETAVKRLGNRSECRKCAIIYGPNRVPRSPGICDECGGPLTVRHDDKDVEAVNQRFRIYQQEISVLVSYYDWKGVLRRVDANGTQDSVFQAIVAAIEGRRV